jgi:serine/threonine-protein kinase
MKAAADRPLAMDSLPFAFGPGESPVSNFVIREGLAQNELGETYLAEDPTGRRFVLRRLRKDVAATQLNLEQLAGRKLTHAIPLRQAGAAPGETWVVRDYQTGWSLADVLAARSGGMSLKEARRWLKGIAAGLRELAACGTIHSRLKPSNVWLERGVVKLVDGGLPAQRMSYDTTVMESPVPYAAPETVAGRFDKADLYALGAMLAEMLAGRRFDPNETWETWIAEPYRPILARALDPDPALRWNNADEFLAALEKAPPNLSPPPSPEPAPVAGSPRTKEHWLLWSAVAAGLMILAVAFSLMLSAIPSTP